MLASDGRWEESDVAGTELASAYLTLIPSMKGAQSAITSEVGSVAKTAGEDGGALMGAGITSKVGAAAKEAGEEGGGFLGSGMVEKAAEFAAPLAGALGVVEVVKTGVEHLSAMSGVTAQLNAGLASTGGASGVTTKHMLDLANSVQDYSGQSVESIANAQKMLLTFTNINNNGPDKTFDRATKLTADMAAKMGIDGTQAAKMLGRALQDPAQGMGSLSRAGVVFTTAQRNQVKAMEAAGNMAGAQKFILDGLTKSVGGAAAAYGNSFPGMISRVKLAFEDFSGNIVQAFMPIVGPILTGVLKGMDLLAKGSEVASEFVQKGFEAAKKPLDDFVDGFKNGVDAVDSNQSVFAHWGAAVFGVVDHVKTAVSDFMDGFKNGVDAIGSNQSQFAHWGAAVFGVVADVKKGIDDFFRGFSTGTYSNGISHLGSEFSAAFGAIQQTVHTVISALKPAFDSVGGMLKSMFSGVNFGAVAGQIFQLSTAFNPVHLAISAILPLLPQILSAFGQIAITVGKTLLSAFTVIAPVILNLSKLIVSNLTSVLAMILPIIIQLIQMLVKQFVLMVPIVLQIVQMIVPFVMQLIQLFVPLLMNLIHVILPVVIQILQQIFQFLLPLIQLIMVTVIPIIQALLPVVSTVFNAIAAIIQAAMQIVEGVIQIVMGIITGNWSMVWQGIVNVFSGIWNLIVALITGFMNVLGAVITADLGIISAVWGAVWGIIVAVASSIWNWIVGIVTTNISAMQGQIAAVLGWVQGIWGAIWNWVSSVFGAVWGGIVGMAAGFVGSVQGIIGGAVGWIQGVWNSAWSGISGFFSSIWGGIISSAQNGVNSVLNFFQGIPGAIAGVFAGAGSWLVNVGSQLINGLISGISSMAGSITSALIGLLPGPLQALAHTLGIASPSRVMRDQFGKWIPLGLAAGIDDQADAVAASMNRLVRIPGSLASGVNGTPGAGGRSVSITNHIQTNDPEGAAVAVTRRLQRAAV